MELSSLDEFKMQVALGLVEDHDILTLACNENTPTNILDYLAVYSNYTSVVARNHNTSEQALKNLALTSKHNFVRADATRNPVLSTDTLKYILEHSDHPVICSIAAKLYSER